MQNIGTPEELLIKDGSFRDVILSLSNINTFTYYGSKNLSLNLEGTKIDNFILQIDSLNDLPTVIKSENLTYNSLFLNIGYSPERFVIDWINRQDAYSPQPTVFFADSLRKGGDYDLADFVLYIGKERGRHNAWNKGSTLEWIRLTLLKYTVGYGLGMRYIRILWYTIPFLLIGTLGFSLNQQSKGMSVFRKFVFTLDRTIPIIEISKDHKKIELTGRIGYYFIFLKIFGYFLVALYGTTAIIENFFKI
jgi:hypothetical protein